MSKRYFIKPAKDLRENARLLVPVLLETFLSQKARVVGHPRLKRKLHRMRLDGKTLRYAMEVFEPACQKEFAEALEELKRLLECMGRIHDCDIHIPRLQSFLRELRPFNHAAPKSLDKIPTFAIRQLMADQRALRHTLFMEVGRILEKWESDDVRTSLLKSITTDPHPIR